MSRARNLADLLDASGDVVSGALDNANDASALTTGTLSADRIGSSSITAAKLATDAAVSNLGYTPGYKLIHTYSGNESNNYTIQLDSSDTVKLQYVTGYVRITNGVTSNGYISLYNGSTRSSNTEWAMLVLDSGGTARNQNGSGTWGTISINVDPGFVYPFQFWVTNNYSGSNSRPSVEFIHSFTYSGVGRTFCTGTASPNNLPKITGINIDFDEVGGSTTPEFDYYFKIYGAV